MLRYQFKVGIVPAVAATALFAGLVALGLWQLERAREKLEFRERIATRAHAEWQRISPALVDAASLEHYRAVARGYYDGAYQVLLDNRVRGGQPGYHVITPLRLAGGETRLLVNRGWVPWGSDRGVLPEIDVPQGLVEVRGRLHVPSQRGFTLGEDEPLGRQRPARWQRLDLSRYGAAVPHPVQPVVMELAADAAPGGFVREWTDGDDGWVARHRGYAFQWFALAATLAVIFVMLGMRRSEGGEDRDGD